MTTILAIDPGNVDSAYVVLDTATCRPLHFGKVPNPALRSICYRDHWRIDRAHIEMIRSYGMAVGAEVFDTCVWIGRFAEALNLGETPVTLTYRGDVKIHHCHTSKATDRNVRRALVDRFTPGARNFGKGTKDAPGFFYGFHSDIWAAFALAVYAADQFERRAS